MFCRILKMAYLVSFSFVWISPADVNSVLGLVERLHVTASDKVAGGGAKFPQFVSLGL